MAARRRTISAAGLSDSNSAGRPAAMSRWSSLRTRPTAAPELTPMPSTRTSRPGVSALGLVEGIALLLESSCDEPDERVDGAVLVVTLGTDDQLGPTRGREQQDAVDSLPVGRLSRIGPLDSHVARVL